MLVPPDMEKIKAIAKHLDEDIRILEELLKQTECNNKANELRAEIKAKGLVLHGYQRTLNSIKYN